MSIVILGIDLGKNSCGIVGLDADGTVIVRRRMRRDVVIAFAAKLRPCTMAMDACCGAHHMGRSLADLGHQVRLMPPEYVRPYVKSQKNDDRDAEAIAEAATRPSSSWSAPAERAIRGIVRRRGTRFVELKSEEQLDVQTLHRVRDRLVGDRTSPTDQIRSLLLERGYVVAQGHARLRLLLGDLLDCGADVLPPPYGGPAEGYADAVGGPGSPDRRIAAFDAEVAAMTRTDDRARRLTSIPGIGALNATALVAALGAAATFDKGRDLAAWLGRVPRQATTGGRPRLLGITKRGSRYLRKMPIQGARSAMPSLAKSDTAVGAWLRGLLARAHPDVAVVALAAKMARTVRALLRHGQIHTPAPRVAI